MDIVRTSTKKKFSNKQKVIFGLALLVTFLTIFWLTRDDSSFHINKNGLLTDQVKRGELDISVRGTGVLVPEDIEWLAINVPGKVQKVVKKAGAKVKKGDVILELSNTQLQQELIEAEWQLQVTEAETTARQVSLESALLDQEIAVINEELNFQRATLTLKAQQSLLDQGVVAVSRIDFETNKINASQYKQLWDLELKRLEKRRQNIEAQAKANNATLISMRKKVQLIQEKVDSLSVKATMDSILLEMPLELGQQVSAGHNLAKLARDDRFIAEIRIPEKQVKDVMVGQSVTIDTRNTKVAGLVQRIDPAVINNTVQVDVELTGPLPKEARPELTVDGEIKIVSIPDTLYVKRPMYSSGFDELNVYQIDETGNYANRKKVKFGHMSSRHIEIVDGLNQNSTIIISDTSDWENHQKISIR